MKTVIVGAIVFLLWSTGSTYVYVCEIKGLCPEEPEQIDQASEDLPPEETAAMNEAEIEPEPEPVVESPGLFTLYHNFNQQEFIPNEKFGQYLNQTGAFVRQSENAEISVIGFADNIGSDEYNYSLGLERAAYTKKYMIENGIPEKIISISSKGETSPAATNETEAGRAQNRRTEIQINK